MGCLEGKAEAKAMENMILGILAVLMLAYLLYAVLRPEKF